MPEAKIKAALIRFNEAIKNSDGAGLSASLNEVEALFAANRASLHPQLIHFLEGRSYAKALAWLGAGEELSARPSSPPGGCQTTKP
jgi:hypothetical protein